jgi:hypothetical protein
LSNTYNETTSGTANETATEPKHGRERRVHERTDATLEMQGTPEDGGVVARMVTSNLSMGGLHCVSTANFPEMTRLAVRLMLPLQSCNGNEPLDLEAVVVRQRELQSSAGESRYELALFFTGLDNGLKERLARFLQA